MSLEDNEFDLILEQATSDNERLIYLREIITDQIKNIVGKESKTDFFLLITITLYFLINNKVVGDINIGPFQIINSEFALIFIPPIFAFLLLRLFFLNNFKEAQKNNLVKVLEKLNPECEARSELRILIPFEISFLFDLIDFNKSKFWSIILVLIYIPALFGLIFFFFGIQLYWLFDMFTYWKQNWFFKTSIVSTTWLILLQVIIFLLMLINSTDNSKNVETL